MLLQIDQYLLAIYGQMSVLTAIIIIIIRMHKVKTMKVNGNKYYIIMHDKRTMHFDHPYLSHNIYRIIAVQAYYMT